MADIRTYAKPSQLHRYRPLGEKLARELAALHERYIFCPKVSDMNDPMEGAYRASLRFAAKSNSKRRDEQVQKALQEIGVASLSETYDHEPM
jgi:hypothetical protein